LSVKFSAKISKFGARYIINIPQAVYPQISQLVGKKIIVEIRENE
jgi:hypothetical protein